MDKRYNLSNYQTQFTEYLIAENISSITLKNYRSDLKHFFSWVAKNNSSHEIAEMITFETITSYRQYSAENNAPLKTINRRLSTLRKFCTFCISQGWLSENPAKKVINVTAKTEIKPQACHPRPSDVILEERSDDRISKSKDRDPIPAMAGLQGDNKRENDDYLAEFGEEFPKDFANLSDFFQIINYPQFEGKIN